MIIEDVCVPPARVAEAAKDLQRLLGEHGFLPGVAGHASAGNLHFLLTPNFGEQADLDRYEAFMGDLVELIVGQVRRLAEGRARHRASTWPPTSSASGAPQATEMMWRVKQLADPDGILAPGRRAHARPGRAPAQPQVRARDRGGRHAVHRVRLLRAGLPEPRPDDDPAPADRAAPRDGAPAARLAGAGGAARAVRVRRASRRAPRTAPAASRAPSASTRGRSSRSCGRASTPSAPSASRSRSRAAGAPSSAPRAAALRAGSPAKASRRAA